MVTATVSARESNCNVTCWCVTCESRGREYRGTANASGGAGEAGDGKHQRIKTCRTVDPC